MGIDAVDTVKSAFGSLNTPTGLKVFGLLFVVQLANSLGTTFLNSAGAVGGLVSLLTAVATLVVMVGALRSFDSESFETEHYTQNLSWPVLRAAGANAISTLSAYGLAILAASPAILAVGMLGTGFLSLTSIPGLVLSTVGLVLGAAALFYVLVTMIVSVPMVAVGDNRMFQALDRSIRRTKGHRKDMALALLPLAAVYLGAILVMARAVQMFAAGGGSASLGVGAASALISSFMAAALFSLLTEYNQRLPEE